MGLTAENRAQLASEGYTVMDIYFPLKLLREILDYQWAHVIALSNNQVVRGDVSTYQHWPPTAHGMLQTGQAGANKGSWLARQRPEVIKVFEELWNVSSEELLTSLDSFCLVPGGQLNDPTLRCKGRLILIERGRIGTRVAKWPS